MKETARNEFEAWAAGYDDSLLHHFLFRPSYRIMLAELLNWQRTRCPFDILDVGCGTGTFAAMTVGSGLPARVVGLDYASSMCKVASRKAGETDISSQARFLNGDSEHLPFASCSFDAITCSNSFHHYPHQDRAIKEMFRVLRREAG